MSAQSDLHIVLSTEGPGAGGDATVYSLVLGGEDNMYSWISKGISSNYYKWGQRWTFVNCLGFFLFLALSEIQAKVMTPKLLRQDRLQTFWISWDHQKLSKDFEFCYGALLIMLLYNRSQEEEQEGAECCGQS